MSKETMIPSLSLMVLLTIIAFASGCFQGSDSGRGEDQTEEATALQPGDAAELILRDSILRSGIAVMVKRGDGSALRIDERFRGGDRRAAIGGPDRRASPLKERRHLERADPQSAIPHTAGEHAFCGA